MEITPTVPEPYLVDRTPGEWRERILLVVALSMFPSGEMSAGAAAEIAGIDRFAFASECARRGIPLIDYAPGALRSEVESLAVSTPFDGHGAADRY